MQRRDFLGGLAALVGLVAPFVKRDQPRGKVYDKTNAWPWVPDGPRISRVFDANGQELTHLPIRSINTATGEIWLLVYERGGMPALNESGDDVLEVGIVVHAPVRVEFVEEEQDARYGKIPFFSERATEPKAPRWWESLQEEWATRHG